MKKALNIRSLMLVFLLSVVAGAMAMRPDSLQVGIVTCAPGADIYQLEGHTALHLQGRYNGQDIDAVVNYGVFDFNSPNFVYRFVKGETDYMCAIQPWSYFISTYMREGRGVTEHPVLLDSIQTERLMYLLSQNLLPQNCVYRYNYVKDNCATRPLRIIEMALGDSIILPEPVSRDLDGKTFREIMSNHHRNYPWYQFGIDLALGSGIDYQINTREKSFAPTLLGEQLDSATVSGRRLTAPAKTMFPATGDTVLGPTPWYATPLAVSWALFAIALAVTVYDIRRRCISRWFDTLIYTVYGVAGIIIAFLVFISVHEATSPNWLLLWLNPLCLAVPIFIWLKKCKIMVFSYQIINFALILTMIVAWPFTGQSGNAAFIPLVAVDLMRSATYIINYHRDSHSRKAAGRPAKTYK